MHKTKSTLITIIHINLKDKQMKEKLENGICEFRTVREKWMGGAHYEPSQLVSIYYKIYSEGEKLYYRVYLGHHTLTPLNTPMGYSYNYFEATPFWIEKDITRYPEALREKLLSLYKERDSFSYKVKKMLTAIFLPTLRAA